MQATLLIMCFAWCHRQHKLGIDDFGHPLHNGDEQSLREPGEGKVTKCRKDTETIMILRVERHIIMYIGRINLPLEL